MKDRVIKPIAYVKNNFPTKFGLPRQSGLAKTESYIVFEKKYSREEAFRGIEGFSHLWIIWGFDGVKNKDFSPTVRPPMLGGNERVGVFATRSPNRPNGLGLSVVEIKSVDFSNGVCKIKVTGGDFADGTAVYDVKPYLGYVDAVVDAKDGFAKEKEEYKLKVIFQKGAETLSQREKEELMDALSRDPRPQYHEDGREYGFFYSDKEIRFKVCGDTLTVTDIKEIK